MRTTPLGMLAGWLGATTLTLTSAARLPASTSSGSSLANTIDCANSTLAIVWLPVAGAGVGAGLGAGVVGAGAVPLDGAGAGASEPPPQPISAVAATAVNSAGSEGFNIG
ncbi:MAG TPA: hypothetical protein VLE45_09720 [Burkholderiaceae bacterium]|nr:hypothetical protein [Burkholderiaceae bacterium]